ncbi:type II toxin-antitoxin system RelE/ParE family toxin [Lachnospiraceae bacterium ZAX-1]
MENKDYHIRYTPLAYEDLDEIDTYISEKLCNPIAAQHLMEAMETSIHRLQGHPLIGAKVNGPYLESKGYRKLAVEHYLVFYLVNSQQHEVIIMRVLYGGKRIL